MRALVCCAGLFAAAMMALAADSDFNGKWDITVPGEARSRVWWLGVQGAGTAHPKATFVGAPGGQVDPMPDVTVKDGVLRFTFKGQYRIKGEDPKTQHTGVYEARVVDGKLQGTFHVEGVSNGPSGTFTGVRAPEIKDHDGPEWKPGTPVELVNGHDLSNWSAAAGGAIQGWSFSDGVLRNSKEARDIVTNDKFWNFLLHCEYKVAQHSNSGIGLRNRYEIQIFGDYGEPTSVHGNGALYSRIAPAVNATLPPDQWQTLDVRLVGLTLTVKMNGKTLIDHREIEGLTAVATDPNEAQPGAFILQGDHGPVEVRNFIVTPLVK